MSFVALENLHFFTIFNNNQQQTSTSTAGKNSRGNYHIFLSHSFCSSLCKKRSIQNGLTPMLKAYAIVMMLCVFICVCAEAEERTCAMFNNTGINGP